MEDFYIDKRGNVEDGENNEDAEIEQNPVTNWSEDEESNEFLDKEELDLFDELTDNYTNNKSESKEKKKFSLDDTYLITSYTKEKRNEEAHSSVSDKLLAKSAFFPGLESQNLVSSLKSKKALKIERKKLRERTKGKKWFDIPATEVTEEIKTDFALLKMRSVLDSKHVYKKNDITRMPKYFQVGKVVEGPADFYGGRIPKSQRKTTMVEELLADAQFKNYQKKKYKEIMDANRRMKRSKKGSGDSKLKKKRKFK